MARVHAAKPRPDFGRAAEQLLIVPREAACSAGDWLAVGWLAAVVAINQQSLSALAVAFISE